MGTAEKELEEHLLDVGNRIIDPPSSVDELLPLLDQAETFLSRVEQSPSRSMLVALRPAMRGLATKELLEHSDADVKVAVASCISEITRITAPDAPYDDDLMQEIFQMIVEAFRKLDDTASRSYAKRVSILETVAKVRSCVVMLDLECDSLILEMFHHFLNTIRDNHPENVSSSMEMIMTLVLEESEDIPSDLLSSLLMSVKKNNKDILPIARKLAEKVIGNCASKLKPYLIEEVESMGASLNDFSKIISSVCQESSDVLEQNGVNSSAECLAEEGKKSERVPSDETPQGSQKVEPEISHPVVSSASDKLSRSLVSNGAVQARNGDSMVEPTLPNKKTEDSSDSVIPRNTTAARLEIDKVDTALDHGTKKARGQKSNAQPAENRDHSQVEAVELPNRRKGRGKKTNILQSRHASEKEAEATTVEDIEKGSEHPSEKPINASASAISPSHNENLPDSTRPKRGRPSGSKVSKKNMGTNTEDDVPASPSVSKKRPTNGNIKSEESPSMDSEKEQIEGVSDSENKPLRHSGKRRRLENMGSGRKSSTNSHLEMASNVMVDSEEKIHRRPGRKPQNKKASEDETSGKHRVSKTKQEKGGLSSDIGEPSQKENLKMKYRKKRVPEEISEVPHNAIKYDESLVGVKIKVLWPDDREFYPGVIDSYDPATMKHKILYSDGDVEDLLLRNETFEFLKGEKEEEETNDSTPEAAEISRKKAKLLDSSVKSKAVASSKSGESAGKVSVDKKTKSAGKRGVNSTSTESAGGRRGGNSKNDDNTPTGSTSKKKGRRSAVDTPKGNMLLKDELNKKSKDGSRSATPKTRDNISKSGRKSKGGTPRTGSGSKDDASSKIGSSKNRTTKLGSKVNDDSDGTGSKLKLRTASPSKSRRKLDANGSAKGKTGSSMQVETKDLAIKVNSNSQVAQESEERSGKKRRKKSQS